MRQLNGDNWTTTSAATATTTTTVRVERFEPTRMLFFEGLRLKLFEAAAAAIFSLFFRSFERERERGKKRLARERVPPNT